MTGAHGAEWVFDPAAFLRELATLWHAGERDEHPRVELADRAGDLNTEGTDEHKGSERDW